MKYLCVCYKRITRVDKLSLCFDLLSVPFSLPCYEFVHGLFIGGCDVGG